MSVHVTYTGDANQLLKEEEKLRKSSELMDKAFDASAKSAKDLEKAIKKMYDQAQPAAEKYAKAVENLDKLLKKNKLTEEQHAFALQRLNKEYQKLSDAESGIIQATEGVAKKFEQVAVVQEKVKSADLGSYFLKSVTGILSAGGAAKAVIDAMREIDERAKKAAQFTAEGEEGLGPLAQLAASPEEMQRLTSAARTLYRSGGASSLGAAGAAVFEMESAGKMGDFDLLRDLASKKVIADLGSFVQSAVTLQTTIGAGETGDIRSQLGKALAASKVSPASAESILAIAAESGGVASTIGVSDEELLAAGALLSKATGKDERARTQLRSFLDSVAEKQSDLGATNIADAVAEIEKRNLAPEYLAKLLGRTEAVQAFRTLQRNKSQLASLTSDVAAAGSGSLVDAVLANADADPLVRAAREKRISDAGLQISRESKGQRENEQQTAISRSLTALESTSASEMDITIAEGAAKVADMAQAGSLTTKAMTVGGAVASRLLNKDFVGAFRLMNQIGPGTEANAELLDVNKQQLEAIKKANESQRSQRKQKVVVPQ